MVPASDPVAPRPREQGLLVFRCMVVSEREVLACIRAGAWTVDAVGERCDAGTGCGSCRPLVASLIERAASRRRRGRSAPGQLGLLGD